MNFRFPKFGSKKGFGIVEVLVASLVLGLLYVALSNMQKGNREMALKLRARDGAVEVAQQVIDSLNRVGVASVPCSETKADTTFNAHGVTKEWDMGTGGKSQVAYTTEVTTKKCDTYEATAQSRYDDLKHVYAKQVDVKVMWNFKGTQQSINVSGTVR